MKHIYPPNLEKEIKKYKYIPRKVRATEHMKLYHKYWIPFLDGISKIDDIMLIDGTEYYMVKFGARMHACISYPVVADSAYELLHNKGSIEDNNIINSNTSYSGAEIKFWFIINNINLEDPNYKGFWPYINPNSMNVVADAKYYFVVHDNTRNQKFQMILDKSKS